MSRRGENIYRRKDGRWEGRRAVSRMPNGKLHYKYVYGHSYFDVKQKLNCVQINEIQHTPTVRTQKFEYCALEWFNVSKINWKESTAIKYYNLLHIHILPIFGKKDAASITQAEYQQFCFDLMQHGGKSQQGLSSKTVSDITSIIKNILLYAKRYLKVDTTELVFRSKINRTSGICVLSKIEQEKLSNYLLSVPNQCNIGILLCLFTGMRIGEVCALRWDDVMLDEGMIFIHRTMQRIQVSDDSQRRTKILISSPKSDCSIRKIPVPDIILQILLSISENKKGFFLTGSDSSFIEPRTMHNRFKDALRKSGITDTNFHTLRHTFATRCIEHGIDVKTLSEILGHANVNITLNRYVHPSMELKKKSVNMLSDLITVN